MEKRRKSEIELAEFEAETKRRAKENQWRLETIKKGVTTTHEGNMLKIRRGSAANLP